MHRELRPSKSPLSSEVETSSPISSLALYHCCFPTHDGVHGCKTQLLAHPAYLTLLKPLAYKLLAQFPTLSLFQFTNSPRINLLVRIWYPSQLLQVPAVEFCMKRVSTKSHRLYLFLAYSLLTSGEKAPKTCVAIPWSLSMTSKPDQP